jgi:hypothetical protein
MGKILHAHVEDYDPFDPKVQDAGRVLLEREGGRLPDYIRLHLRRASDEEWARQPKGSSVGWRDVLTPRRILQADGAQVVSTTSETIMCPDVTLAADYMEVGDAFKYTLLFSWSSVITTPGTFTFRLRWGGVGGTALATSGAFAPDPTAASTSVTGMVEYYLVVRSIGSAGSMFAIGRLWPGGDFDDASATTLKGNLDMVMVPSSAPAAVGSLNTTTAQALSPTVQFTVSGSTTNLTTHIAILESLN